MGKRLNILLIILIVPLFSGFTQNVAFEKDPILIEEYDAKAWSFRKTLPDSTIYYADLIINQLRSSSDTSIIAKYFNYKGIGYYYKGDNYTSFNYYTLAYNTSKALGDSIQYAHSMNNLGRFFSSQGNYVKAFDYSNQALLIFEQLNHKDGIAYSQKRISEVYTAQGYMTKALQASKNALQIRIKDFDNNSQATAYIDLANVYLEMDSLDEAKINYSYAKNKAIETSNVVLMATGDLGLSEYFIKTNHYDSAIVFAQKAKLEALKINNQDLLHQALVQLGKSFYYSKELYKAKLEFEQIIESSNASNQLQFKRDAFYYMAKINASIGQGMKAYEYQLKFDNVDDQLNNIKDKRAIDSLLFQTEIGFQEKENNLLLINNEIDKELIATQKWMNNLMIITSLLLLAAFIIISRNSIKKKKTNRLLVDTNKKILAQKEELKANLEKSEKLEQQLLNSNQKLESILNSGFVSIITTTTEGIITHFSKGAENLLGYSANEMVDKVSPAIIHDFNEVVARGQELSAQFNREISGFEVFITVAVQEGFESREWTYVKKNGERFPVQLVVSVIRDDKGVPTGYLGVATDVTEQKNIKENLKKLLNENEFYREIVNNVEDIIYESDNKGLFTYVNPALEKLTGYTNDELLKMNYLSLTAPNSIEKVKKFYFNQFKSKTEVSHLEFSICNKAGDEIWVNQTIKMVFDGNQLVKNFGVAQNISAKKQEELKTIKYQNGLRLINNLSATAGIKIDELLDASLQVVAEYLNLPLGIISIIRGEEYTVRNFYNNNAPGLVKGQKFEFKHTYCNLTYNNDKVTYISEMASSPYAGHPCYKSFGLETYIGAIIYVGKHKYGTVNFSSPEIRAEHFDELDEDFMTLYANWIGAIIESNHVNKKLRREKEKAEMASKAKADFLSVMSHEIRTPLNGVIGLTNLLLQGNPRKDQIKNLNLLRFSGDNLLVIINDILDFNKIDAGKISLESTDFNLYGLLDSIQQTNLFKTEEKGIDLILEYDQKLPQVFIGDSVRLGQVINNLVSNAIKFTSKGFVKIECKLVNQKSNKALIHFSIQDSGKGIDNSKFNKIFEHFSQEEESTTRKYGGTGLGLPISKKLLKLMNSEIEVESELDKGSIFSFEIILPIGDDSLLKHTVVSDLKMKDLGAYNLKILIAEDNEVNYKIASTYLAQWNIHAEQALDGNEVIEKAKKGQYDLILMDLQMPNIDGYEATIEIRKFNTSLPIIALTASVLDEVKRKAELSGMNGFISKPMTPHELFDKITSALDISHNQNIEKSNESVERKVESINHLAAALQKMSMGDEAFIKELTNLFIGNLVELEEKLSVALQNNDEVQARDIVHKVSTTLVTLELESLQELARLAIACIQNKSGENKSLIIKVKDLCGEIINRLKILNKESLATT